MPKHPNSGVRRALAGLAVYVAACGPSIAASLSGSVINGTTGKPAAHAELSLLSANSPPAVLGRASTDAEGRFLLDFPDSEAPAVVRVIHQGLNFDVAAPAGGGSVNVRVYEAALEVEDVAAISTIRRYQAAGDTLNVVEETAVRNASQPPRILINDRKFEFQLPPEAKIAVGRVQAGGGRVRDRMPSPAGQGRYYFQFPIAPGDSRFAVAYRMPYKGEVRIEPPLPGRQEALAIEVSDGMSFVPETAGIFRPVPGQPGKYVLEAAALKAGQSLAFRLSGGAAELSEGPRSSKDGKISVPDAARTVAGGLARSDLWFLAGGMALVLAAAGIGVASHLRKTRIRRVRDLNAEGVAP